MPWPAVADHFVAEGDRLVSLGVYAGANKARGKVMRGPFVHVWRVVDRKLKQFDMYADTLLVAWAIQA